MADLHVKCGTLHNGVWSYRTGGASLGQTDPGGGGGKPWRLKSVNNVSAVFGPVTPSKFNMEPENDGFQVRFIS